MNICLVGSILRHTIETDGGSYSGWGGMTESAVAPFATLLRDDTHNSKIYFVGSVGKDDIAEVKAFFATNYPFVDTTGIRINPTGTDHHHGTKHFVKRRVQVEPTRYEHIEPYIHKADVVIFNFGNIDDIDPEAIQKVKEHSKALVYVDVHRKPFGADEQGYMYTRGWPGWEKYLKYADVVQMDKNECEALFGKKLVRIEDVVSCAKEILDTGAGETIITLGSEGALVGHRTPSHAFSVTPAVSCDVRDTTGCGDAFAAGYLVSRHEGMHLFRAVGLGATTAAVNCEFVGYMKDISRADIEKRAPTNFNVSEVTPEIALRIIRAV